MELALRSKVWWCTLSRLVWQGSSVSSSLSSLSSSFSLGPSFGKEGLRFYQRLNEAALKKMPAGSLLWTFSCSQVVDAQLFEDTLVSAAIRSGRVVRILRRLGQPADHPTLAGHSEARYLKGLVLHVE